jgi:hypothetical protein
MTETMMNFRTLLEKAPDADILREMISFAAERLMQLEVGALTGAAHGEKSPLRLFLVRKPTKGYSDIRQRRFIPSMTKNASSFPGSKLKPGPPQTLGLASLTNFLPQTVARLAARMNNWWARTSVTPARKE